MDVADSGTVLSAAARDPKRVLIADDSRMMRDLARRALAAEGYRVECAADGAEAWGMLGGLRFDLVATDSVMPEMDGFELLSRIQGEPRLSAMPVVLIVGSDLDDRQRQLAGTGVSVIPKGLGFQAALVQAIAAKIGKADS